MTIPSSVRAAPRPDEPCFLVFAAPTTTSFPDPLRLGLGAAARRVRVVPDAQTEATASWPSFDGFAVFDGENTLKRLFVIDPDTRCILEWRLPSRVLASGCDGDQASQQREAT